MRKLICFFSIVLIPTFLLADLTGGMIKSKNAKAISGKRITGQPDDNEILKYDSSTGKIGWEADASGSGGGSNKEWIELIDLPGHQEVWRSSSTSSSYPYDG